jgi:hypothetical protein
MGLFDEIRRRQELELEAWRIQRGDDQQQFFVEPKPAPSSLFQREIGDEEWDREEARADRQWEEQEFAQGRGGGQATSGHEEAAAGNDPLVRERNAVIEEMARSVVSHADALRKVGLERIEQGSALRAKVNNGGEEVASAVVRHVDVLTKLAFEIVDQASELRARANWALREIGKGSISPTLANPNFDGEMCDQGLEDADSGSYLQDPAEDVLETASQLGADDRSRLWGEYELLLNEQNAQRWLEEVEEAKEAEYYRLMDEASFEDALNSGVLEREDAAELKWAEEQE